MENTQDYPVSVAAVGGTVAGVFLAIVLLSIMDVDLALLFMVATVFVARTMVK